jgi:hypothetical protein
MAALMVKPGFDSPAGHNEIFIRREEKTVMSAKPEYPLDHSAAFTALLELSPVFAKADTRAADAMLAEFLRAWYADSDYTDMFRFAREWLNAQ